MGTRNRKLSYPPTSSCIEDEVIPLTREREALPITDLMRSCNAITHCSNCGVETRDLVVGDVDNKYYCSFCELGNIFDDVKEVLDVIFKEAKEAKEARGA